MAALTETRSPLAVNPPDPMSAPTVIVPAQVIDFVPRLTLWMTPCPMFFEAKSWPTPPSTQGTPARSTSTAVVLWIIIRRGHADALGRSLNARCSESMDVSDGEERGWKDAEDDGE